jgi:hypothetical protein
MQVFGIEQLIPSPRVLRKNDGAVTRMIAEIWEYEIPIRVVARLRHVGGAKYRLAQAAALQFPATDPTESDHLVNSQATSINR